MRPTRLKPTHPGLLFLLCLICFALSGCPSKTTQVKTDKQTTTAQKPKTSKWSIVEGTEAPAFTLRDIRGRSHELKKYRGSVILLNFWATWCRPCLKEFPHFQKLQDRYKSKGLKILAVSIDEGNSVSQVAPMIYRYGYNFTVLLDTEGRVVTSYNPKRHCPYTALIDRKGQLRLTHQGYNPGDEKDLAKHIRRLLRASR